MRATAVLPLHHGRAPRWLFGRMVKLAECIVEIIVHEYGVRGLLERLSDPWFFQSLSCVLGYDWHSSGTTTVTCGALKEAVDPGEMGFAVVGGKGKASRKTPAQIEEVGQTFGLASSRIEELKYASRMAAKVDNSLIQDGYSIYHHTFFFDEAGRWIVVQQGINEDRGNARRYHWPLDSKGFIEEPQNAILCQTRIEKVLDMTSKDSDENRRASLELVIDNPRKLRRLLAEPTLARQCTLESWTGGVNPHKTLVMPSTMNWRALTAVYEFQPGRYEELVAMRGIGPSTVRGLSLIAELVYGEKASWSDPVRYSFAFGGKDGVPFPVDRGAMDGAIDLLRSGIGAAPVKRAQKMRALQRLRRCVPPIPNERLPTQELG